LAVGSKNLFKIGRVHLFEQVLKHRATVNTEMFFPLYVPVPVSGTGTEKISGFVHFHRGMFGHLSWLTGTHLPVKKEQASKGN
jgi:hypothetical protein